MSLSKERDMAIIIAVAIIEKDGNLLMVQEGREDVRGKWNVPAGHIKFGENPIEAVVREAKEETGLDVEPTSFAGFQAFKDKSGMSVLRLNFNCKVKGGSFEEADEDILNVRWMSMDELKSLKEQGKLRSDRTWWSIKQLSGKRYPLEILDIIEGRYS